MRWDGLEGRGRFRWKLVPYTSWSEPKTDNYILEVVNDCGEVIRLGAVHGVDNARMHAGRIDVSRDPYWNRAGSKYHQSEPYEG